MTNMPRSIVIGTAGHIDHGKTTLVRALTGIDTDRLPEEKRRGITIDLGFASLEMQTPDGSPLRISFVDVPGHSLFIRNMLAGTGCVQASMLVIAANEGVMPQTVEHLAICDLLGISQGITVVTKADSVSTAQLQEVIQAIEAFLLRTFPDKKHAPILHVSAATGEGVEMVRAELLKLAMRSHLETPDALMRLPLDRSFLMKGFGTVVTGTLLSGTIQNGQTLQLEPGGRMVRVRGLQTHGQHEETAEPGSRVAVNLSGVDAAEVNRGQTLVAPGTYAAVDTIDVEVRLLKSAPALKHRANIHFHAFTSETMATISLYGYEAVQPGTFRLMRITLAEPIVLVPGDRFVLRQPLPAGTIGGGRVLDVNPERRERKATTLAWLEQLKTASPAEQILLRVRRQKANGITYQALSCKTGLAVGALRNHVSPALQSGDLLAIGGDSLLSREALLVAGDTITSRLQPGRSKKSSELRSQTGLIPAVFDFAISSLVREHRVQLRDELVSLYNDRTPPQNEEKERVAAIARVYEAVGLASPSVAELAQRFSLKEADMRPIITALLRSKAIVRMGSDDLFIHSEALRKLVAQVAALRGSLIDVARFKEITGLSRKYAIPLLEYLDRERITRKQGDHRRIL
jgi:selenocysteine-specific elongation factor